MTGSKLQLYNGILLLGIFFSVRLLWGTYQSSQVIHDIWLSLGSLPNIALTLAEAKAGSDESMVLIPETMQFVTETTRVSAWAAGAVILANMTLNFLNYYWFTKMIEAVRKRFVKTNIDSKKTASNDAVVVVVHGSGMPDLTLIDDSTRTNETIKHTLETPIFVS